VDVPRLEPRSVPRRELESDQHVDETAAVTSRRAA
jgi:hypothetical protein